jgi:hypothetical protein
LFWSWSLLLLLWLCRLQIGGATTVIVEDHTDGSRQIMEIVAAWAGNELSAPDDGDATARRWPVCCCSSCWLLLLMLFSC